MLQEVKLLVQMHSEGLLGGERMPEDVLVRVVPEDELPNVLTLGMSLNYQRNSYTLWQSVSEAYLDNNSHRIFNFHTVAECALDKLRDRLLRHRVALQPNRHPEIWQRVAHGIVTFSPRGVSLASSSLSTLILHSLKTSCK